VSCEFSGWAVRVESPKRRYQRTARTMISGGNRKPLNAELGKARTGRERRGIIPPPSLLTATIRHCNRARQDQ
jgi:hypothetical protein